MIIGLAGLAGSGKSTIGDIVTKRHGFQQMAFGDILKEHTANAFNLPLNVFYDVELKDEPFYQPIIINTHHLGYINTFCPISEIVYIHNEGTVLNSPREMLQFVAHDICRKADPDIWVKLFAKEHANKTGDIAVTDVRYPNERAYIKDNGGRVFLIVRPGVEVLNHESEQLLGDASEYDAIITNDRCINELEANLSLYFNHLLPIKQKYAPTRR